MSADNEGLLSVTPSVAEYSIRTVVPRLNSCTNANTDKLSRLLMVSTILTDPEKGVGTNKINPSDYFIYDKLSAVGLGFLSTWRLPPERKQVLQRWRDKYMRDSPADVFFAPSADEIVKSRAAFGCTHYARAFMAVVKALGLIACPEDLRYVVSCKADDYNQALSKRNNKITLNGHQFVMVKIDSQWIAINTSKGESTTLPAGFSPESCAPPHNIPVRFQSYPDVIFLIRAVGKNWDDDCGDNSLSALMNISRSGDPRNADFLWEHFVFPTQPLNSKDVNNCESKCSTGLWLSSPVGPRCARPSRRFDLTAQRRVTSPLFADQPHSR